MRGKIEGVTDKRIEEQMVKIEYWREKLVKGILSKLGIVLPLLIKYPFKISRYYFKVRFLFLSHIGL